MNPFAPDTEERFSVPVLKPKDAAMLIVMRRDERRIAVFAEVFNALDDVNLGGSFTGNGRSVLFRQPSGGFIPGIGYPRQLQGGTRFF
jgi:hypothetical protein